MRSAAQFKVSMHADWHVTDGATIHGGMILKLLPFQGRLYRRPQEWLASAALAKKRREGSNLGLHTKRCGACAEGSSPSAPSAGPPDKVALCSGKACA